MSPQEHQKHLQGFETDRLLKILAWEAAKDHNKIYSMLASHRGYQVAYGTPADEFQQRNSQEDLVPVFPVLKAAIIHAIIAGKTWEEYYSYRDVEQANRRNAQMIEDLAASVEEEEMVAEWASAPEATIALIRQRYVPLLVPICTVIGSDEVIPQDLNLCPYAQRNKSTACISRSGRSVCGGYLDHNAEFTLCQGVE